MPVELVPGSRGVFDVTVDGVRVFSKHEAGRFPEVREALALLAPYLDADHGGGE